MSKSALIFILILSTSLAHGWNTPVVSKNGPVPQWLWTGAGGNSLWTNGSNWCGTYRNGACQGAAGGPPTSGASPVFDDTCVANANNCSPTGIPSNYVFNGLHLKSTYPGTLAFANRTVTVNSSFLLDGGTYSKTTGGLTTLYFRQTGGVYSGGSGAMSTGNGNGTGIWLTGGTFTATSGSWTATPEFIDFRGVQEYNHAGGSMSFITVGNHTQIYPGGTTWNTLTLRACNRSHNIQGTPIVLDGHYSINTSGSSACAVTVNGQYIEIKSGNLYRQSGNNNGSTTVRFTGNGVQIIDGTAAANGHHIPSGTIAQGAAGTIRFNGRVDLKSWDDSPTLGSIDPNGQIIGITEGTYNSPYFRWPQLRVVNSANWFTGFTALETTDLVLAASGTGIGSPTGEIKVFGNVTASTLTNGASGGIVVSMAGTLSQNIDLSNAVTPYFPLLKVNKPSGTLSITGVPILSGGFNYVTGTFTQPASVKFGSGTTAYTAPITSNGYSFADVEFVGENGYVINDDMDITGDIYFNNLSGQMVGPGLVKVGGNVTTAASARGFTGHNPVTAFKFVGTNQSLDATGATNFDLPGMHFAGAGTTTVAGPIELWSRGSGTMVNHTSGAVDATGSNITFGSLGAPYWYLLTGTIEFGSISNLSNATLDLAGSTMTVNGPLTLSPSSAGRPFYTNGGVVVARSDFIYGTNGMTNVHAVRLAGNSSDLSMATGASVSASSLTVAKNVGQSVRLITNYSLGTGQSMYVTSGRVNLNGRQLTISGGGALSLAGQTLVLSSGTLTVNGSNISPGAYGGGTVLP